MKTRLTILAALVGLVSVAHAGSILLNETFSGNSLDSSLWKSSTPYSDSAVTVGGGNATLTNGGGILSQNDYAGPLEVAFRFAFVGGQYDSFRIVARADDFFPAGYAIQHGIAVSFRSKEDTGNLLGNVTLEDSGVTLATGTFALSVGTFYTGRLVDTGSAFSFYWGSDLTPFLTATSNNDYGDKVGAFNRQGAASGSLISAGSKTAIDSIIVTVPEAGITGLYLGMAGFVLFAFCRLSPQRRLRGQDEYSEVSFPLSAGRSATNSAPHSH